MDHFASQIINVLRVVVLVVIVASATADAAVAVVVAFVAREFLNVLGELFCSVIRQLFWEKIIKFRVQ